MNARIAMKKLGLKINIAAVGHDTKTLKAPEEIYMQLADCCKYRDPKVVKDHND